MEFLTKCYVKNIKLSQLNGRTSADQHISKDNKGWNTIYKKNQQRGEIVS